MFFLSLGAFSTLIFQIQDKKNILPMCIYALCSLTMFGISTLYHRIYWSQKNRLLWKKLDHAGIYLMIAGTFTPVAMMGLSLESGKIVLWSIWSITVLGIIQSLFFVQIPKFVSSIFYLIAGYLILPFMSELNLNIGLNRVLGIIFGGIAYSIGAICYAFKWPHLNPKILGYHEFFHLFVNLGAILHFMVIYSLVLK